jgi:uncharacterized protein
MTTGSTDTRLARAVRASSSRLLPPATLAAAILFLAVLALPRIRFEFSLEDLFPRDTPAAAAHRRAMERYGRDDGSILVALEGDPFDPRLLALEERAATLDGVVSATSPLSWRILDGGTPGVVASRPLRPEDDDILSRDLLVATDGQAGAVMLRIEEELNHHAGREPIVAGIEALLADIPGRWHLGGVPVIRVAYVRAMQRDLAQLLPLAMAVSLLFLAAALRDWRHVLLCSGTLILATLLTGSLLVLSGSPFTIFTPALLAVVLVVGTSDLVHLVHRYAERFVDPGACPNEALVNTMVEVGPACLATSATTAVGFLSLLTTSIPQIRRFGAMTALGVMVVFACSMLLVPPVLRRLGPPRRQASRRAARNRARMASLGTWLVRRRAIGPVLALVLVGLGISGALQVETDPEILGDVRSTPMARSNDFLEAHLGAVLPLDVHVELPQGDLRNPELLEAVGEIEAWLRAEPMVGGVVGPSDLVRQGWGALGEAGLPPSREAAAQVLLLWDLVDPGIAASLLADPGSARIRTRVQDRGHRATIDLVQRLELMAAPLLEPHGAQLHVTGVAWLAQEINRTLTRQFGGSFLLALGVVGLLGFAVYRRVGLVVVALVPNTLPLLALLGLMGWTGLGLQPATAMVFSVALGIAVDDTIHFLATYRRLRMAGCGPEQAVVHTVATVGRTLVDTSLLLAGGFVVFAVSQYGAMALFGQLTAFCVMVAVVADLLVLGPLLVIVEKKVPDS